MRKGLKSLSVSSDDSGDSDEDDEENPVTVTVKHQDSEQEDYLNNELSICNLFEVMATHLSEAHPEDPLDSLIEFLSSIKDDGELESGEEEASEEEEVSEEEEEPSRSTSDEYSSLAPNSSITASPGLWGGPAPPCRQVADCD